MLRYLRYDVRLEADWLGQEVGRSFDAKFLTGLRRLKAARNIPALFDLALQRPSGKFAPSISCQPR